jgi:tetratricopeptide (TPR) repeat protein
MTASSGNTKKQGILTPEKFIRTRARMLPLGKCYINESWYDMGKSSLIISRKHSNGNITCGFYLVDLFCVGVKDSFYLYNISEGEFEDVLDEMSEKEDLLEIEYSLAHNIIYGSLDFAGSYEFKPHKSFQLTKFIMEDDKKEVEFINIPFGIDNKPAVVVSQEDPRNKIINHLKKLVGDDNFIIMDESEFETDGQISKHEIDDHLALDGESGLNGFHNEEYAYEALLGNFQDYAESELLKEVEALDEADTAEAIGPIHELFVRLQDAGRFESFYEKHSQIFDEILVVNDFSYPGLNYLPEDQLQAYYELGELTEKNPEDAVIAIKKKLENCPHPVYEHLMVSAYGYLGMHEEATQLLKQAIEKYSNDFMLRVGYGFILLMNEQYDSLKMFMSGFDLKKVVPDREVFHIMELGRYLCLVCSYYALTNQLFMATVYQKILDDFSDIPEGTYYQKLTTFKILCPLQWEYIQENYRRY